MMNDTGILTVISGFSGAGKGTLMRCLLERYPNYALSVSCTTRPPRPGEEDGRDYYFVTEERFQEMIERDAFLEHAVYCGCHYGTPRTYVDYEMSHGKDVLLEIEMQGALQIKEKYPEALMIFVTAPSAEELRRRLTGRGTESEEVIHSRMSRAIDESSGMDQYDYLLVNDDLDTCVSQLHQIIQDQHHLVSRHLDEIEKIRRELRLLENKRKVQ